MVWWCLMCILCHCFTWIASWRDIPGGLGPFRGMGRQKMPSEDRVLWRDSVPSRVPSEEMLWQKNARAQSRSSGLKFNQSGIPLKNRWIGPGSALGNCPAGTSRSWNHNDSQSPFHDLHCCHWTADVEDLVLCRNPPSHIVYDIVYNIIYEIEDAPKRRSLALDIGTISKFWFDIEYDIVWQYWIGIFLYQR